MNSNDLDTTTPVTHVSLCAGYGGIDLGLKRVLPNLRTVAFSEIEAFACANLVAKMEAGLLDAAPVWTDLKTFPWDSFHGKVDILSGGYPCQPFSAAGKRLGAADPRHLWPFIADGIRRMQPAVCFFENVEGHISLGLREVLRDLESVGYSATWGLFSAAEVGSVHQRKRIFVLAHRNDAGLERYDQLLAGCRQPRWESSEQAGQIIGGNYSSEAMADAASGRSKSLPDGNAESAYAFPCGPWPSRPSQPQFGWEPPRVVGQAQLGNANELGSLDDEQSKERRSPATIAKSSAVVGNAKMLDGTRQTRGQRKAPVGGASPEQHERETESSVGRNFDGPAGGLDYAKLCVSCDNRTDELRLLGNGVVPATAERAFRVLSARFQQ